ncbi:hypothetical protein BKA65DRAFT_480859 [Rhexocercosporidium sp. MPI-PUGE-AT-0058]|nr:hypothetical protein BKA65DRAFT_480859 [Rhexocercosporidium sp. MPI-PUGE-AT-0058]
MAQGLRHISDPEKYVARSNNWKDICEADQPYLVANTTNFPNSTIESRFTGFLQPRYLNGTFDFQGIHRIWTLRDIVPYFDDQDYEVAQLRNTRDSIESKLDT